MGCFCFQFVSETMQKRVHAFSQKAEIMHWFRAGHGPGEDPYEDGRLRFVLEDSVCVFRFLEKFKGWFWKLRV